nr:hypothetical protein [Nitratireductor luteus]
MFKFLSILSRREFIPRTQPQDDGEAWRRDPLAHPVLQAMSQRELADLPLGAGFIRAADQPPRR